MDRGDVNREILAMPATSWHLVEIIGGEFCKRKGNFTAGKFEYFT
jgi:hypothetical protein